MSRDYRIHIENIKGADDDDKIIKVLERQGIRNIDELSPNEYEADLVLGGGEGEEEFCHNRLFPALKKIGVTHAYVEFGIFKYEPIEWVEMDE